MGCRAWERTLTRMSGTLATPGGCTLLRELHSSMLWESQNLLFWNWLFVLALMQGNHFPQLTVARLFGVA